MKSLKRMYSLLAFFAMLHVVALVGGGAYLVSTGKLDAERARTIVEMFRTAPVEADDAAETAAAETGNRGMGPALVPGSQEEESQRRLLEREYMQADHRLILANRQMAEVRRRQEDFERRQDQFESQLREKVEEESREGFMRDLEIVSMLKPKVALDALLSRPVDEAARMMTEMEPRKSKKIIESASKDPRKWAQILQIQERMRNQAPPEGGNGAGGAGSKTGS